MQYFVSNRHRNTICIISLVLTGLGAKISYYESAQTNIILDGCRGKHSLDLMLVAGIKPH